MIREILKLQKQLSNRRETKTGVKEYSKYVFSIPPDVIRLLDWDGDGSEFEARAHKGKLVIEKKQ